MSCVGNESDRVDLNQCSDLTSTITTSMSNILSKEWSERQESI
jgi:hypothetical protein